MSKELLTLPPHWTAVSPTREGAVLQPEFLAEPESGSIMHYWRALARNKKILATCSAVGLLLGVGVALLQPAMYRANSSLEIQDVKNDASKFLNPTPEAPVTDPLSDIQTQIKILQSRTLMENVLSKLHIRSERDLGPRAQERGLFGQFFASLPAENKEEPLAEKLSKNLKVAESGQTRIIDVSFDASDPSVAARLVNTLTAEYIEQNLRARWESNHRMSEWLGGQLDEQRTKLRQSEDALQSYARQTGLMYTGEKQNISEDKLRQLQMELSKAQADRVEKQSRSEIARTATLETVPEVLNDNNLRSMESTLTDLRRQEAQLSVTFKPDYTRAKQLRAEIQALETAVAEKRKTIGDRIDNELQESERREQLLAAAYARQTHVVTDDSEKSIQYDMLKHEVDTNRQIYQTMLQRVKESSIASAMKITNVRILDAAKAPTEPYKPNLPLTAGAGFMAGLVLSFVSVIIRSKTDGSVREPGDAGMLLGIPELGVIPTAETPSRRMTGFLPLLSGQTGNDNIRSLEGLQSPVFADSFRAVLASILFTGAKHQVLVVTSASPGEGKTTLTANLAMTLAKMNRKVLLIDGDIRSPQLHRTFGFDNACGLTDLLKRASMNEKTVDSFLRATNVPNLHVLTSGPGLHDEADLLFSAGMPGLLSQLRNQFDMVLIDTPPMLMMPDARVIGRFADAVVLIARARKTSREAVQTAYRRFMEDRTRVLGIVLNDWNAKTSLHSYYSGYPIADPEPNQVVIRPAGA